MGMRLVSWRALLQATTTWPPNCWIVCLLPQCLSSLRILLRCLFWCCQSKICSFETGWKETRTVVFDRRCGIQDVPNVYYQTLSKWQQGAIHSWISTNSFALCCQSRFNIVPNGSEFHSEGEKAYMNWLTVRRHIWRVRRFISGAGIRPNANRLQWKWCIWITMLNNYF